MNNLTSINYNILDALKLYADMFINVKSFPIFAIAALLLVLVIGLNINNKNANFLYYIFNTIVIGVIVYKFGSNILDKIPTFFKADFYKNIYLYLTNIVISLILITSILKNKRRPNKYKYVILIFYYFILVNSLFMLSMAHYLNYDFLMVLVNTYPMVLIGNVASFGLYITIIVYWLFFSKKIKKHRFGSHL